MSLVCRNHAAHDQRVELMPEPVLGETVLVTGGVFRADLAFDWAVQAIRTRRVDVRPLISAQIPLSRALEAFELAADKTRSTKVQVISA